MKTAVSIPDDLFADSEELAKRLGLSRSALYGRALREFLERSTGKNITEQINAALKEIEQKPDPLLKRAARKQLRAMHEAETQE